MEYDAIVIGAGVGGLFSAFKLCAAGKRVLLLEKQPSPGGFATTFSREGFTFEAAVHCVDALARGGEIRNFLEGYGLVKELEFIALENFGRIIYPEHNFVIDFNRDNFLNFLKEEFPQERNNLDRLFCEFDGFYREFDKFSSSKLPLGLQLSLGPFFYPKLVKVSQVTAQQLMRQYIQDSRLEALLTSLWGFLGLAPAQLSAFYFLIVLRLYFFQPTAYVKGGLANLFQAMVKMMRNQGAQIWFNTTAKQIITEGNTVKAVITDKGEEFKARVVVSNANPVLTLGEMLDEATLKEKYRQKLSTLRKSLSAFQVYLGLRVPALNLGMQPFMYLMNTTYDHSQNFRYALSGDYQNCAFSMVDHAQLDPSLAPPGQGTLLIFTLDNYAHWKALTEEQYQQKKKEVAQILIRRAQNYLPGLSQYIEVMEVATPRTMLSYGSSPEGAIYGFAQTPGQAVINRLAQETKIKGLFLASAWTRPGAGVHACFISGVDAADLALKYLK